MSANTTTHYRTCNLCEAMCGLEIEVDGDEVTSIRGDERDVFSHGHICPKATALKDVYDDPDRLKQPVRRVGDRWEPMSWDDAFDEVTNRLHDIQEKHGRNAIVDQHRERVHVPVRPLATECRSYDLIAGRLR